MIDAEVRLAAFERRLAQASDIQDCWAQLRAGTVEFGFKGVRMVIDGRVFEEPLSLNSGPLWQLRIPLEQGRYINFFREFSYNPNNRDSCKAFNSFFIIDIGV